MTRFLHDTFFKQLLSGLLEPMGQTDPNFPINDEQRFVDLFFQPKPAANLGSLGLLGRMVTQTCLLEPFRNPVGSDEINACLLKLFVVHSDRIRAAKRNKAPKPKLTDLPRLWILTPTASRKILHLQRAQPQDPWPRGVYFLAESRRTAIVVLHQLPKGRDTLWLRILGRGSVQRQAIEELIALPLTDPVRDMVLRLLNSNRIMLNNKQEALLAEERELLMNLSPAYLQWEEETLNQGREQGRREGRQEEQYRILQILLEERFGSVDADLAQIIDPLLQLNLKERTHLLLNLSREDLLDRLSS